MLASTSDIYLLLAWGYEQMGLYESALADFNKMIELEPLDYRTCRHRARVLNLMRQYNATAKGEIKAELAVIAPGWAGTRTAKNTYFKSRVCAALGMKDEAIGAIELAIDKGFEGFTTTATSSLSSIIRGIISTTSSGVTQGSVRY